MDIPEPCREPQVISGKRYNVATVKKLVLFPQQMGSLVVEGFDLVGYMRTSFFNGQNVTAAADPVKIEVNLCLSPFPPHSWARLLNSAFHPHRSGVQNQ